MASWKHKGRGHDHVGVTSVRLEENIPWIGYVWPCSAHQKCVITADASPLPCARRWPCWSTWPSKPPCILPATCPPPPPLTSTPILPPHPSPTPLPCHV